MGAGNNKVNIPTFIRGLGTDLETKAGPHLKQAMTHASSAADEIVDGAGLASGKMGGLPAMIAGLFAAEYAERSFDTKTKEATQYREGADTAAKNWEKNHEETTI